MGGEKANTQMITFSVRVDREGLERLDLLGDYLHRLGVIKANSRAEVVRLALNRLWTDVRLWIEKRRYGAA